MVKVRPEHLRRLKTTVFVNSYAYSPELYPLSILLERDAGEIIKEAVRIRLRCTEAIERTIKGRELVETVGCTVSMQHSLIAQVNFLKTQVQRLDHLIKEATKLKIKGRL